MIRARHHWFYELVFDSYIRLKMGSHFREIRVFNNLQDNKLPLLLLGNHSGWWDGFFQRTLSKTLFGRRFHVMMLEDELAKRRFLSRLGAFSIKKKSRSVIQTLNYASTLLENPENMVLLFPQGRLQSMHCRPLVFEPGWFHLVKKAGTPFQIAFMVTLMDYGNKPRPTVSLYLESYPVMPESYKKVESDFNDFLDRCITIQSSQL